MSQSSKYQKKSTRNPYPSGTYETKNAILSVRTLDEQKGKHRIKLQSSKPTLLSILKGSLTIEQEEESQTLTIGESLIIPPHISIQILDNEESQWSELQLPTLTINQIISQFGKECRVDVQTTNTWQFGKEAISITHDKGIKTTLERLLYLFIEEHFNKELFIDFALRELILRFLQTPTRDQLWSTTKTSPNIEAVLEYIKEHIDEPISIDTLTEIASMSKAAFFRTFKETLDISPIDYINRERVEIAKNRLIDLSKSVTDICYELGYNHMTYFIRVFKKYEGITPKQFQMKQNRKKNEQNSSNEEE